MSRKASEKFDALSDPDRLFAGLFSWYSSDFLFRPGVEGPAAPGTGDGIL